MKLLQHIITTVESFFKSKKGNSLIENASIFGINE
jgi:hypothetical protein